MSFPERQSIKSKAIEAHQQINASQKNMAPAFLVLHHPGSPFTKSSPLVSAFGSFLAFLQPGSVHAEIVTENLKYKG
jgi:hypothetical protein